MKDQQEELMGWLQNWYGQHCDNNWEHNENLSIRTIDNPGWRLTIDLTGTSCENKPFEKIEKEITENDWFQCFLRNGKFEGAGGPTNLVSILQVFKEWANAF